jgi:cytochrome c-type biogenesis protein
MVFGAGLATLVTPCILPMIPLWLGLLMGNGLDAAREKGGRFRLLAATVAFALGFMLVFTLMGLGASFIGGLLTSYRSVLMAVGGIVVLVFSLKFLHIVRIPWLEQEARVPMLRTGHRLADAALFGVVFALGWTPCVGPILGTVLTYTATQAGSAAAGALYLATYGLGIALPLVVLSVLLDRLLPLIERLKRWMGVMERATGVALAILGIALIGTGVYAQLRSSVSRVIIADSGDVLALEPEPSDRPRLVELYRTDCPVCRKVMPSMQALRSDCLGRQIDIVEVNLSDPRNAAAAGRFEVSAVPTFVLLDRDGAEMGRVVGGIELPELRRAAASLMGATCAGVTPGEVVDGSAGCPGLSPAPTPEPFPIAKPATCGS